MSADFWAGYISGAIGIIVGNPLDRIKVVLQSSITPPAISTLPQHLPLPPNIPRSAFFSPNSLIRGASAPILGYGALNALLFTTYSRCLSLLSARHSPSQLPALGVTFVAGAIGGLATFVVSTPTELIKCRAQLSSSTTSWDIIKEIVRTEGVRGLYLGGTVTALRDSIGYGFYFWSYEISSRWMKSQMQPTSDHERGGEGGGGASVQEAAQILLCGGLAGVITWASIFPLDVIKTRLQTQNLSPIPTLTSPSTESLLSHNHNTAVQQSQTPPIRLGAVAIARQAYANEGLSVFFRGLAVCSVRAFIVNAVQWAVYEWIMRELDPARKLPVVKGDEEVFLQ